MNQSSIITPSFPYLIEGTTVKRVVLPKTFASSCTILRAIILKLQFALNLSSNMQNNRTQLLMCSRSCRLFIEKIFTLVALYQLSQTPVKNELKRNNVALTEEDETTIDNSTTSLGIRVAYTTIHQLKGLNLTYLGIEICDKRSPQTHYSCNYDMHA